MSSEPPQGVLDDVARLNAALDVAVPTRSDGSLLIATWNIRAFGDLTASWIAGPGDTPKRDWHAIACLAAIVGRFDVVAVQETRRNTAGLRALLALLGPQWRVICSDVTEGQAGNGERLAFVYDSDRVLPSGLVGELVLPPSATGPDHQFARSPYLAGFTRAGVEFILTTVHVLWGTSEADRLPELTAFATWMRDWAYRPEEWNSNLLVLGDFNLDRVGDPLFEAFLGTGLWPPDALNGVPRTVFDNDNSKHFYDQIAWFSTPDGVSRLQSLTYSGRAGGVDFVPHVFHDLTRNEISWRMSDHYPLWVEFHLTAPGSQPGELAIAPVTGIVRGAHSGGSRGPRHRVTVVGRSRSRIRPKQLSSSGPPQ